LAALLLTLGLSRRILLFPLGNVTAAPYENVAVYFEHVVADDAPSDWHVCAQFALIISNPNDPTIYVQASTSILPSDCPPVEKTLKRFFLSLVRKDVHHRFTSEEADWGFTQFSKLRDLYSIQEGKTRPIIENESADITVYTRVMKDPTGVLWHDFRK
jgi:ubiquitin carboxyl-terminal hydrolase 7